jgi:hypothetical protein
MEKGKEFTDLYLTTFHIHCLDLVRINGAMPLDKGNAEFTYLLFTTRRSTTSTTDYHIGKISYPDKFQNLYSLKIALE